MSLRDLLLTGELVPGQRVSEIWAVDRLGVSRTPVRAALARLEEEGFLEALPAGGYAVKSYSQQDVFDGLEIRGALEGLAARLAAERGVPETTLQAMSGILDQIDCVIGKPSVTSEDVTFYARQNEAFHLALAEACGGRMLPRQIERAVAAPFAHPSAFIMAQHLSEQGRLIFILAQDHHRSVLEAIRNREGTRAEALMCEHARLAARNLKIAFANQEALGVIAGAQLIRMAGPGL